MSGGREIKILVVEDSAVARALLLRIFEADPEVRVVGSAGSGEEALALLERAQPDVITMDINLPGIDGLETARRIMLTQATPIVVISSVWQREDRELTKRALRSGALTILEKPKGPGSPNFGAEAKALVRMVKEMSEVRVVTRKTPRSGLKSGSPSQTATPRQRLGSDAQIVAIGASTGGPPVLRTILEKLPASFPLPILIVQHIACGFAEALASLLNQHCALPVQVAEERTRIQPGQVYLAPTGGSIRVDARGRLSVEADCLADGTCPSVEILFESVAEAFGRRSLGILLTGMGKDGAEGLALLKEQGALTIAQDEESSVVFGMPGEAVKLGAAIHVLPPEAIAQMMIDVLGLENTTGN